MTGEGATGSFLVTGIPRSGTTWVARLLATSPRTALAGREPMNPRGRQYALGHSLPGWVRLTDPTSRQRRALVLAYRGLNPQVYSRYGRRQWAAPLPGVRVVVKDPFAMLSLPAIVRTTGTSVLFVYRHPGAVLASYRRMGWEPDLEELQPVIDAFRRDVGQPPGLPPVPDLPAPGDASPARAMGLFWAALHAMALVDFPAVPRLAVVSHEELAGGGVRAANVLFDRLGLGWSADAEAEVARESGQKKTADSGLHNLDRPPAQVASAWRATLDAGELAEIESVTEDVRSAVETTRLDLA